MFANTTPDIATQGIRAVINDQIARNVWSNGGFDDAVSLANYRALARTPWLSTVIEPRGDTFVLRAVVKSSPAYGTLGDLLNLLHGLDDYPLIDDEVHGDLVHETVTDHLSTYYPALDTDALLAFIYENSNEAPYLEGSMSVYIPEEDDLIAEFKTVHGLTED